MCTACPRRTRAIASCLHLQVQSYDSKGPFKHDLVLCGAPVPEGFEPQALAQWLDYHRYALGVGHAHVYDAGGLDGGARAELRRFVDAGVLSIHDFKSVQKFEAYAHGQVGVWTPLFSRKVKVIVR